MTNGYQARLDAEGLAIFNRQLEQVKAQALETKRPPLKAMSLIPVSYEISPGAKVIVYHIYNEVGLAKIVADYADDLPRVDLVGDEMLAKIVLLGVAYGYSFDEARNAAYAGIPLEQRKANTANKAVDQLINRLAFTGDANFNLVGLLNHPNVPRTTVANDGTASATEWSEKTPAQILRDMYAVVDTVHFVSNGVHTANTLLLPISEYQRVSSTQNSTATDLTILEVFKRNRPGVMVDEVLELAGAGVDDADADVMIAYEKSPENLQMEIPMAFVQHDAEQRNLELVVPCEAKFGGVNIYYPMSIAIAEGIGPDVV